LKGGALLPVLAAGVTPLILLGIIIFASTVGLVEWRPPVLWTDQFGTPPASSGVGSISVYNGSFYVNGYLNNNGTGGLPFIRKYNTDRAVAWTSDIENIVFVAFGLAVGSTGIYVIGGGPLLK
jgi:hypothetical protein